MTDDEIIEKLKDVRMRQGLGQIALADLMLGTQAEISRYERKAGSPRLNALVRWAEALGYEIVVQKKKDQEE